MELRGHRRAKKPQSGLFSRHYFNGRAGLRLPPREETASPFLRQAFPYPEPARRKRGGRFKKLLISP